MENYQIFYSFQSGTIYRLVTGVAVFLALVLALWPPADPRELGMPDPWAYAVAIESFAQGKWVLNNEEMAAARVQVQLAGGRLLQYAEIAPGQWALRKSPGYPLLVIPFERIGQPRLANAVLAILAAIPFYAWLARWRSEFTACLGVIVLLWAPITLLAIHVSMMDTFASGASLVTSGSLVLLYGRITNDQWQATKIPQQKLSQKRKAAKHINSPIPSIPSLLPWLLFAGGLAAGWSIVIRLQNAPVLILLSLFTIWLIRRYHQPMT